MNSSDRHPPNGKRDSAPATFTDYADAPKGREASVRETAYFLQLAMEAIDQVFDEPGYAARHPELAMAFMQSALFNFHALRFGELLEIISQ
jgi:hypothetical protein